MAGSFLWGYGLSIGQSQIILSLLASSNSAVHVTLVFIAQVQFPY